MYVRLKKYFSLPRGTISLIIIGVITVVLGFLREATIAYFFGTSATLDAFLVAFSLPQIIAMQLPNITVSVMLPEYLRYHEKGSSLVANELLRKFFLFLIKSLLVFTILTIIFANTIIKIIGPGLSAEAQKNAIYWLRLLQTYLFFVGTASCFKIVLDANQKFFTPAISRIIITLSVLLLCFLCQKNIGVQSIVIGLIVGGMLSFAVQCMQILSINKNFFKKTHKLDQKDVKIPYNGIIIMTLNVFIVQAFLIIDRAFASKLSEGSISVLNYANAIITVPSTILSSSLATALFPILSSNIAKGYQNKAIQITQKWLFFNIVIGSLLVFFIVIFSTNIVTVLLVRGNFDMADALTTASVLRFLSPMIILSGVSTVLTKLLQSQQEWNTIIFISICVLIIKLILNNLFIHRLGLEGLALASIISITLGTALRYFYGVKRTESE